MRAYHQDIVSLMQLASASGAWIERPRLLENPSPSYPRNRRFWSATVWVDFVVATDGSTSEVGTALVDDTTADPEFSRAAVDAIKRWRFRPGTIDGHPAPFLLLEPVVFSPFPTPGMPRGKDAQEDHLGVANEEFRIADLIGRAKRRLETRFSQELAPALRANLDNKLFPPQRINGVLASRQLSDQEPGIIKVCVALCIGTDGAVGGAEYEPLPPATLADPRFQAIEKEIAGWRFSPAFYPTKADKEITPSSLTFLMVTDGVQCWTERETQPPR